MTKTSENESCLDARVVALYVGIFMIIISGLTVFSCIGGFVYICFTTSWGFNLNGGARPKEFSFKLSSSEVSWILLINGFLIFILIISLLEFALSMVLVRGASEKKTSHLKIYFVYGNVKSIIIFLLSITLYIIMSDNIPGAVALLCCGMNSVFSAVVHMAYIKIERSIEEYSQFDNDTPANIEEMKTNI